MSQQAESNDRRDKFLMQMYGQMWSNVNRHITVVWQSVAVLAGAFAVLSAAGKGLISLDVAIALVVGISAWVVAHTYDANTWFNRNLGIIANIERQFLKAEDARDIHFYFTEHRSSDDLIEHLQLQRWFGLGAGSLALVYHFFERVLPGIGAPWRSFELARSLPYLVLAVCLLSLRRFRRRQIEILEEFQRKSPGVRVEKATEQAG